MGRSHFDPADGLLMLRRILEVPDDDGPRLIYSDWLEENNREAESLLWRGVPIRRPDLYDHHGYCQTHFLHEKPCPHETIKQIKARMQT